MLPRLLQIDKIDFRVRSLGVPSNNFNEYDQSPSSFVLTAGSPNSGKYLNRNNSMTSDIDSMAVERSAFSKDIESKNQWRSKSMHELRENKVQRLRYYTQNDVQVSKEEKDTMRKQISVDLDENDAEQMGFITRKRKKSKSKSFEEGGKQTKKESNEHKKSVYTQYAVRNNEQQININNEYNINNGHLVMERKHISSKKNGDRWTKLIVLAALFICFILGVLMGIGVSWLLFV